MIATRLKYFLLIAVTSILVIPADSAFAAVYWNNNTGNNNYADPGNWNSFPDANPVVNLTGADRAIVSTDTFTLSPAGSKIWLANNIGTTGEVEVTSSGHLWMDQFVEVGYEGTGYLTLDGGTITTNKYDVRLGYDVGSNGSVAMYSGTINAARYFVVGDQGTGYLEFNDGTISVEQFDFTLGLNAGSVGTVDMYGGTINVNRYLKVGYNGVGTLNLYGGTINAAALSALSAGSLLNITGGTLVLDGDVAAAILANPQIVAYGGSSEILADSLTIPGKTIVTALNPYHASNLNPVDFEADLAAVLTWTPGLGMTQHKVYFSTNEDDVINRLPAADHGYQSSGYDPVPGDLDPNQIYYWCVDEVGTVTCLGQVVSFTTGLGLFLENDKYNVAAKGDMNLRVTEKNSGVFRDFTPEFTIIYSSSKPSLYTASRHQAVWSEDENPFNTGTNYVVTATDINVVDGNLVLTFPSQATFDLEARIDLSTDYNEPALFYTLTAKSSGWFMTAFTGAPEANPASMEMIPQPAMWPSMPLPPVSHSLVFPDEPKFIQEIHTTLPAVIIRDDGLTCAVVVHPDYQSFRQVNYKNMEFGVCIRNQAGNAQPIIFAPQMGAQFEYLPVDKDSYLGTGQSYDFSLLWIIDDAQWRDVYRGISEDIYNVRDQRDNSGPGSMNKLLANLADYACDADGNNYNMWDAEQKCNEYFTDQPYMFKILGGLFAINAAIVLDNNDMFWSRSLPQVEYALSREITSFHPYDYDYLEALTFNNNMDGPFMCGIDLGHLYKFTGGRTTAFKTYAEEKGFNKAKNWFYESLEWYRLWGNQSDLDYAIDGANHALDVLYCPYDFQKFLEIYEETGDVNYLNEAREYAYNFTTTLNKSPEVPDVNVIVDMNNEAPIHWGSPGRHVAWGFPPPEPMYAPEQVVPAWRPATIGMQAEAYRAFNNMEYPGALIRLAGHTNDDFLKALARWALVGRWANHPGQQLSIAHSLAYEQDDFCMHPLQYMTFTSMHFWHHWQHFVYVVDFLVSEAIIKSEGNIDFPRHRLFDGGSGGRQNIWGHESGVFYGDDNVNLWLPRDLLTISTEQINYIAGYGNGNLYLALSNQSFDALNDVSITFSPDRVGFGSTHPVRVWQENVRQSDKSLSNGIVTVDVAASGLTVLVIENVEAKTGKVHTEIFRKPKYTLAADSLSRTDEPFGKMVGMIISFGPELTEAYCYTNAKAHFHDDGDADHVTMHYSLDAGPWQNTTDAIFPYEFSTRIDPNVSEFSFYFDKVDLSGTHTISATRTLNARKITTISGRVTDLDGVGIDGVQMQCTDSTPAYTDVDGYYVLEDIISGAKTLTPFKAGYEFIPAQRSIDLQLGSIDNANWIGNDGTLEVLDYLSILASNWLRDDTVESQGVPLCEYSPIGDYNGDCIVNLFDFALIFME